MPRTPKSKPKARGRAGTTKKTKSTKPRTKSSPRATTSPKRVTAKKSGMRAKPMKAQKGKKGGKVVMLSGGNPQIAKGYGDAPVKAYIAALSGWKHDITKRIDAIVTKTVPKLQKAVKWNSPMYGVEGRDWFMSLHMFTNYVKVAFFRGTSLRPIPPGQSKHEEVRYADIREGELDDAQMAKWVKQAAALPGVSMGKSS